MQVAGLDHVNILAADLDHTVRFYEQVMGLVATGNPAIGSGLKGAWMRDAQDNAIVHLVWKDPASDRYDGYDPGASTNAVHHVAFKCTGFAETVARLDQMQAPYRINDLQHLGLRQIFVADPNGVNLELNFPVE